MRGGTWVAGGGWAGPEGVWARWHVPRALLEIKKVPHIPALGCWLPSKHPLVYETTGGDWVSRVTVWCPGPGQPWQEVWPKAYRFSWEPTPWWEAHGYTER